MPKRKAPKLPPSWLPVIPGWGPTDASVLFIGEGPGWEEISARLPFYDKEFYAQHQRITHFRSGSTGMEFTRLLNLGGVDRAAVYTTNLLKHISPDEEPTEADVRRNAPALEKEIASLWRKGRGPLTHIIPIGRWATRYLLGPSADMVHTHGFTVPWDRDPEVTVYPVIHPAAGLHQDDQQILIADDFRRLGQVLDSGPGGFPVPDDPYPEPVYTDGPAAAYEALGGPPPFGVIGMDSEGDERAPWSLQFSVRPGSGHVLRHPIDPAFLAVFKAWLTRHRPTVALHYALHDVKVGRALGLDLMALGLPLVDTMILSYHLCRYPQGLKALAWRQCGMVMRDYEDLMRDAANAQALDFLTAVAHWEWDQIEVAVWENGRPKIYRPNRAHVWAKKALTAIAATATLPEEERVDARKRWKDLADPVKQQIAAMLGPMPFPTLDDIPLADAVYYAGRDPDATLRVCLDLTTRHNAIDSLAEVSARDHGCLPLLARMEQVGFPFSGPKLDVYREDRVDACFATWKLLKQEAGRDVNPNSAPQVAKLLFDERKLPPGKYNRDTGLPSTDKKSIEHLRGSDRAADLVITWREHDKARQFAEILRAALREVDAQSGVGRVHFRVKYTRVTSGRYAAEDPNMLAIPAHSTLGQQLRSCSVVPPGYELFTFDLNQIEMRVMAHLSEDDRMCRVFREGKVDIHSETGHVLFKVPHAQLDGHKHRKPSKTVNFGMINDIQPYGLFVQMRMAGILDQTEDTCAVFIRDWMAGYPGVPKFFRKSRMRASVRGFTREMGGRIRYLPGLHSAVWKVKSEAERQAHSHEIQGGAQTIMKDAMVAMWPDLVSLRAFGYLEPLAQIHDEILFLAEEGMYDLVAPIVLQHLTTTRSLIVPIEAAGAKGTSWNLEK